MESFSEYHKDPQQFSFLEDFQASWQIIKGEFTHFMAKASPDERSIAAQLMGPQSKTIKTKGAKKYTAFGVLFQGLFRCI